MTGALQTATDGMSRRAVLAATAAGVTGASSGCVEEVASSLNGLTDDRMMLSITTLPADGDREGVQIARALRENLEALGATVSIDMRRRSQYRSSILLTNDFDIFVGEVHDIHEPDVLYEMLHSSYAKEAGEQNPFGFANRTFDQLLERQRRVGPAARQQAVEDVLVAFAQEQPFVPISLPTEVRLTRTDRFAGWSGPHLASRIGYLGLDQTGSSDTLNGVLTNSGPTQNLNPLTATYRDRGMIIDLVYDSLVMVDDGEVRPWLASSWEWEDGRVTLQLHSDLTFHDGHTLTADDVAFTYRFLQDTSLGRTEVPSPAPRYRREVDMIDAIEVLDEETIALETGIDPDVFEPTLTVPILPAHIWQQRIREHVNTIDQQEEGAMARAFRQGRHSLLTLDNVPAVGSGPYKFNENSVRESLALTRFDNHFTTRDGVDLPSPVATDIEISIAPSSATAIGQVRNGVADVTVSRLGSYAINLLEPIENPALKRVDSPIQTAYIVGFNTQRRPFTDPYFRSIVARLLDKGAIAEQIFEGHATPAALPLTEEWVPDRLAWDDGDPTVPFFGEEGDLDVDAAKQAVKSAGYDYVDDRLQTR
ncbi:MAG: ABC transporter substrate-binding protein [Natrialbaceae archaeon]|nr:ABC transporter substrate-binding protein [Natrialbaceae archaeon]